MTSIVTRSLAVAVLSTVALGGTATALSAAAAPTSAPASISRPAAPSKTAAAQNPRTYTFMKECVEDRLTNRPRRFTLACADANMYLDKMTWKRWGQSSATGTAEVRQNDCSPSCSKGRLRSYPVKVVVNRLHRGEAAQFYTRMKVTYLKAVPQGEKRTEFFTMPR